MEKNVVLRRYKKIFTYWLESRLCYIETGSGERRNDFIFVSSGLKRKVEAFTFFFYLMKNLTIIMFFQGWHKRKPYITIYFV